MEKGRDGGGRGWIMCEREHFATSQPVQFELSVLLIKQWTYVYTLVEETIRSCKVIKKSYRILSYKLL